MEAEHRALIRTNYSKFVNDLHNVSAVMDNLTGILTPNMMEEVTAEKTRAEKVRKLLSIIPRRGPNAFTLFCRALLTTENDHLLKLLDASCLESSPQNWTITNTVPVQAQDTEEPELPTVWPPQDPRLPPVLVGVTKCQPDSFVVKLKWGKHGVYKMEKPKRGRVLIINNRLFVKTQKVHLDDREGTLKDGEDLESLFTQLQFTVSLLRDLSATDIKDAIEIEKRNHDHSTAECFIFVILSHGLKGGVYGVDGEVVPLEDITTAFDGENFITMAGKPKLFFIQACQGETKEYGVTATDSPSSESTSSACSAGQSIQSLEQGVRQMNIHDGGGRDMMDAAAVNRKVGRAADILEACATVPGFVSFRNNILGSWFVQAIVYVFQKFAYQSDILSLMTKVNNLVSAGRVDDGTRLDHSAMSVAQFKSTLSKEFYFFPGLSAPES